MTIAPFAPGRDGRSQVHVALVGTYAEVRDIGPLLPLRWRAVRYPRLASVGGADVVVLGAAISERVAAARLLNPDATIVAVIDARAPGAIVARTLRAGADACVRSGVSAGLAAQVLAAFHLRRR